MVLPLLFGLGASGLASAGLLGSMGPLMAGALGSGLGSALQEGDLASGIQTGLMSFLGGQALGGLFAPKAAEAAGAAANAATSGATGPTGFLKNMFSDPTKAYAGQGLKSMMSKEVLPYVAGAQVGNLATADMSGFGGGGRKKKKHGDFEMPAPPARLSHFPGPGYRPGYDPEFDYRVPRRGYAEGGQVQPSGQEDQQIVAEAIAALRGEVSDPRPPLGRFLMRFGEEALRQLIDSYATDTGSDGMSDSIPATQEGEPTALSEGEFVVPADVVSGLGNGSSDAGAQHLYSMMDRVRASRTGTPMPPRRVQPGQLLPG